MNRAKGTILITVLLIAACGTGGILDQVGQERATIEAEVRATVEAKMLTATEAKEQEASAAATATVRIAAQVATIKAQMMSASETAVAPFNLNIECPSSLPPETQAIIDNLKTPGPLLAGHNRKDLRGLDLRCADLTFRDLNFARLQGADLTGANFTGSGLSHASLWGANLTGANFYKAIMDGVRLIDANLDNAVLTNANLTNAFLHGADMSNVHGMESWQFGNVEYNPETRWPAGIEPSGRFIDTSVEEWSAQYCATDEGQYYCPE